MIFVSGVASEMPSIETNYMYLMSYLTYYSEAHCHTAKHSLFGVVWPLVSSSAEWLIVPLNPSHPPPPPPSCPCPCCSLSRIVSSRLLASPLLPSPHGLLWIGSWCWHGLLVCSLPSALTYTRTHAHGLLNLSTFPPHMAKGDHLLLSSFY